MHTFFSGSAEKTVALGVRLGNLLTGGEFIALKGELGAGKTQFAKGVAAGVGISPMFPVTSPTYTLLNIYNGRVQLYHFDFYRLADSHEILDLGFEEYFYGNGVCLVEWAERMGNEIPSEHLEISFLHEKEGRQLVFKPVGDRYEKMVSQLFLNDE